MNLNKEKSPLKVPPLSHVPRTTGPGAARPAAEGTAPRPLQAARSKVNFICPQKGAQHSRGGKTKNHLTSEPDLAGGSPPGVSSGFYLKDHLSNAANLLSRFPLF